MPKSLSITKNIIQNNLLHGITICLTNGRNKPPEFPKSTIVQIRSTIQGLLERVSKLEDNQSKSAKTIQIFKKTIADLQTKNNSLQTENDQLRDRFNAHATSCETARKNTNSTIKRLEGLNYTEY